MIDKRLSQVSHRRAPVDEVMRLVDQYRSQHEGWSAKHYYAWYRRSGGGRSYNWVRKSLQAAGAVTKASGRGQHRKRRERAPVPGVLLHQDGSTHAWVPGQTWDLIVTMDDASNRHYSMFFCDQEGARSSFQGVREVIEAEACFARCIPTGAAIAGTRRRPAARWTRATRCSSGVPCSNWAWR